MNSDNSQWIIYMKYSEIYNDFVIRTKKKKQRRLNVKWFKGFDGWISSIMTTIHFIDYTIHSLSLPASLSIKTVNTKQQQQQQSEKRSGSGDYFL